MEFSQYNPNPAAGPDGWHQVAAPGGYEWWYFDAEDAESDLKVVAILLEGFVFHPGYLRAYASFLRQPTRRRPPVAGDYPCAYFVVYEKGRVAAQFMTQYAPGDFTVAVDTVDLKIGPNRLRRDESGQYRLSLTGMPWSLTLRGPKLHHDSLLSAELTFDPIVRHAPMERTFLSRRMTGADHRWVLADPMCRAAGTIRIAASNGKGVKTIELRGRGYHDHNYGTSPIGPGLRHWIWGRLHLPNRVITFHHAAPRAGGSSDETHIVQIDLGGMRDVPAKGASGIWDAHTPWGLRYPRHLLLGDVLTLRSPQVIDSTPFYLRLQYAATMHDTGELGIAFCEVAWPNRLRWPILGRMIEMSIHQAAPDIEV